MSFYSNGEAEGDVALLAEGVDRNQYGWFERLLQYGSPSSRRAWIEIVHGHNLPPLNRSPSSRRAWIEMLSLPAV